VVALSTPIDRRHQAGESRRRVTDAATLEAVVSVLAGSANTDLVATLVSRGVPAVGLTGVDAGFGRAIRQGAYRATSGQAVDLGLVGDPVDPDPALIQILVVNGYVPVIASLDPSVMARGSDCERRRHGLPDRGVSAAPNVIATPSVLDEQRSIPPRPSASAPSSRRRPQQPG
jgi:hypothetical protein